MFPTLFKIGFFELRVYSLMYIIGLLVTIYYAKKKSESNGIPAEDTETLIIFTFIFALLGARAYYVFFKWDYYGSHIIDSFKIWHGGLAIHGGVIAGTLAAIIYCKYKKINPLKFGDIVLPFLLFAQGIGRFGNFANGEAHGVPTIIPPDIIFRLKNVFPDFWNTVLHTFKLPDTPQGVSQLMNLIDTNGPLKVIFEGKEYLLKLYVDWGISFPPTYNAPAYYDFGLLPVHPTFFYEMILNFIGFGVMLYFWRKNKFIGTGLTTGLYFIFYGINRGIVTTFRADDLMFGDFRAPHVLSVIFILIGIAFAAGLFKKLFDKFSS